MMHRMIYISNSFTFANPPLGGNTLCRTHGRTPQQHDAHVSRHFCNPPMPKLPITFHWPMLNDPNAKDATILHKFDPLDSIHCIGLSSLWPPPMIASMHWLASNHVHALPCSAIGAIGRPNKSPHMQSSKFHWYSGWPHRSVTVATNVARCVLASSSCPFV